MRLELTCKCGCPVKCEIVLGEGCRKEITLAAWIKYSNQMLDFVSGRRGEVLNVVGK